MACDIIAAASVITPIRPIYIKAMIMILPATDSSEVMPRLMPTVPSAETASNRSAEKLNPSDIVRAVTPMMSTDP